MSLLMSMAHWSNETPSRDSVDSSTISYECRARADNCVKGVCLAVLGFGLYVNFERRVVDLENLLRCLTKDHRYFRVDVFSYFRIDLFPSLQ